MWRSEGAGRDDFVQSSGFVKEENMKFAAVIKNSGEHEQTSRSTALRAQARLRAAVTAMDVSP